MLEGSPVALLKRSCVPGLEPGELGLILAPPGLGKSTLLAQFGLAEMLAGRCVLHVAQGDSISEVRCRYESLLSDYSRRSLLASPAAAQAVVEKHQVVQTYAPGGFSTQKLTQLLGILAEHADFRPETILLDGVTGLAFSRAQMAAVKALAWAHSATMWMTGSCDPAVTQLGPEQLPAPFAGMGAFVDEVLELRPKGEQVELQVCKPDTPVVSSAPIVLDPSYMRAPDEATAEVLPAPGLPARYTLYSGAAAGTEACFGELAESYGLTEVNFSYPGHEPARERGLVVLSERQLRQGDVSLAYASRRMGRGFTMSHSFRRVLQTLWHQVHSVDQVLVVGRIQEDGTLTGGTGWGGELARLWRKQLSVFDQERRGWFCWNTGERRWAETQSPRITSTRFCGTGTRKLSSAGRAAIESVFAETFSGSAPSSP